MHSSGGSGIILIKGIGQKLLWTWLISPEKNCMKMKNCSPKWGGAVRHAYCILCINIFSCTLQGADELELKNESGELRKLFTHFKVRFYL